MVNKDRKNNKDMKKVVIVVPTYNESENIIPLIDKIYEVNKKNKTIPTYDVHVLVVDDNSPDGTAKIVRKHSRKNKNVHLYLRKEKQGLGAAYISGMKHALKKLSADIIVEMDADFQHRPEDLKRMLSKIEKGYDFVIGSRYAKGGRINGDWGMHRKFISGSARFITRYGMRLSELKDVSGGYRAMRAKIFEKVNLDKLDVKGYAFQATLLEEVDHHGYRIAEVPITFDERKEGESKMGLSDIVEGFSMVYKTRVRRFQEEGISSLKNDKITRFFAFGMVGGFGAIINTMILWLLVSAGLYYVIASMIATEVAIISNFIFNNIFTFRDRRNNSSILGRFGKFQIISITTIVGTVTLLWLLTTAFGQDLLLLWNMIAIIIMFIFNFLLNSKFTWNEKKNGSRRLKKIVLISLLLIIFTSLVMAERVAVSGFGHHPDSYKQAVVYDPESSDISIYQSQQKTPIKRYELEDAKNYRNDKVDCQGGNDCKIVDFSDFQREGRFYLKTDRGTRSSEFYISEEIYTDKVELFEGFFNALRQQDSDYHADYNSYNSLPTIADGSFILVTWQAAESSIALSNAYNRNPEMFRDSEIPEQIEMYTDYLASIQGVKIKKDEDGFRYGSQGWNVKASNAIVPGELNTSKEYVNSDGTIDVYTPGSKTVSQTLEIRSLCGEDNNTRQWDECISYAKEYYKLLEDEVGLNMTYVNDRGVLVKDGTMSVSKGWEYDWNCFLDIDLKNEMFDSKNNPCLIFRDDDSTENTVLALAAYLEAIPAINENDPEKAQELLKRSKKTYDHVYRQEDLHDEEKNTALLGLSNFLLYDYTKNESYLIKAHDLREEIDVDLVADVHNPNSYYWEEYILHKEEMTENDLDYTIGGSDPKNIFTNKLYGDYKDEGIMSIGNNAERVFEKYRSSGHQNSKNMVFEGIYATKSLGYDTNEPYFVEVVSQNQLSWLTGMNSIQPGISTDIAANKSISFIFGIGDYPEEFHSRYLIDTGYRESSNGKIIGTRGTSLQFYDGEDYIYFDGKTEIMGHEFGSTGNGYEGEEKVEPFKKKTFNNGLDYIPGWINGAFDVTENINPDEIDVFYNYNDDYNSYSFTESESVLVALMLEYIAHLDAHYNEQKKYNKTTIHFDSEPPIEEKKAGLLIESEPEANVTINDTSYGKTPLNVTLEPGLYKVTISREGYENNTTLLRLKVEETYKHKVSLQEKNAGLFIESEPEANVTINDTSYGKTPLNVTLEPGLYKVTISREGYENNTTLLRLKRGQRYEHTVVLDKSEEPGEEGVLEIISYPRSRIRINATSYSLTPKNITLSEGWYNVSLKREGYVTNTTLIKIEQGMRYRHEVTLKKPGEEEEEENAFIYIDSEPGSNVKINNTSYGRTPRNITIEPGLYNITLTRSGYKEDSRLMRLKAGKRYTHKVNLTRPQEEAKINDKSTNLSKTTDSDHGSHFWMYETENAKFSVDTNNESAIEWKVNEKTMGSNKGKSSFTFSPGILYAGEEKIRRLKVEALADNDNVSWLVDVHDAVNPFFSPPSGKGEKTVLHIYISKDYNNFTNIKAGIKGPDLGSVSYHELTRSFSNKNETEWRREFSFKKRYTHHLSEIILYNNKTNMSRTFTLNNNEIGYFKEPEKDTGSGGGGSGGSSREKIDLIYTTLDSSEVTVDSSVLLRLDAESNKGVKEVTAYIETPSGEMMRVYLEKVDGDSRYGTWESKIKGFTEPGLHTLSRVKIKGLSESENFRPTNRAFYVTSSEVGQNEKLGLVYVIFTEQGINMNNRLRIKLDARDPDGVTNVRATIKVKRGEEVLDEFDVGMTLTDGQAEYGTWEGDFQVKEGDATYTISEVEMENKNSEKKKYLISKRSVYVEGAKNLNPGENKNTPEIVSFLTGGVIGVDSIKDPKVPLIIAVAVLSLTFFIFAIAKIIGRRNGSRA